MLMLGMAGPKQNFVVARGKIKRGVMLNHWMQRIYIENLETFYFMSLKLSRMSVAKLIRSIVYSFDISQCGVASVSSTGLLCQLLNFSLPNLVDSQKAQVPATEDALAETFQILSVEKTMPSRCFIYFFVLDGSFD